MPNGIESGSVSRIVIGWMNDSNCAASTMYMKMNDSDNRQQEIKSGFAHFLRLPDIAGRVTGGQIQFFYVAVDRRRNIRRRTARFRVCQQRHLTLAIDAVNRTRSGAGLRFDDAVERDQADFCRRHDHSFQAFDVGAEMVDRADANFVLVRALVESRRFLSGDQRVQSLRNIADPHAEIGGRVAVNLELHFRLSGDQRRVDVNRVGNRLHFFEQLFRIFLELFQVRAGDQELDVRVAETAARKRLHRLNAVRSSGG